MKKVILKHDEIQTICQDIGQKITNELTHEERIPIVVGIMKGALNFMTDLVKYINTNIFLDYIQVSSYNGTSTTGRVILKRDLSFDVNNRTMILVEDVIDTGISMNYLLHFIHDRYHPKRVILVTLFDKKCRRKMDVKIDYTGKVLEGDDFLFGYGLDYNEIGRNLPDVYGLDSSEIIALQDQIKRD